MSYSIGYSAYGEIAVSPATLDVTGILTRHEPTYAPTGRWGRTRLTEHRAYWWQRDSDEGVLLTFPGLANRLVDGLIANGHEVTQFGARGEPLRNWGQLVASSDEQMLELTVAMCQLPLFLGLPVVVLTASKRSMTVVASYLRRALGDQVSTNTPERGARVVVRTSYHRYEITSEGNAIQIFWGHEPAMSELFLDNLRVLRPGFQPRYCVRRDVQLTDHDLFRIEAATGPVLTLPCPTPKVAVERMLLGPPKHRDESILQWKRRLWRSSERNRAIALVARELLDGTSPLLTEHGLPLTEMGSIDLVVESREHADQIALELPGWPLATRSHADSIRVGTDRIGRIRTRGTVTGTQGASLVVVADGGSVPSSARLAVIIDSGAGS